MIVVPMNPPTVVCSPVVGSLFTLLGRMTAEFGSAQNVGRTTKVCRPSADSKGQAGRARLPERVERMTDSEIIAEGVGLLVRQTSRNLARRIDVRHGESIREAAQTARNLSAQLDVLDSYSWAIKPEVNVW